MTMRMKRRGRRLSARILAALLAAAPGSVGALRAASLEGRVRNGTTSQPAPGVRVQYIQLQQGMAPVASADTNAQGVFRFDGVEAFASSPALLQVEFQGATYSHPITSPQTLPGGLAIVVYEPSNDRSLVAVTEHAIFLRPAGGARGVVEHIALADCSYPQRS